MTIHAGGGDIDIEVDYEGPMFDFRASRAMHDFCREVNEQVAEDALGFVLDFQVSQFRDPTGYYEGQLDITPVGEGFLVHDHDVVYGPWLEGTGSRNAPATSFAGYKGWRKALEATRASVRDTVDSLLPPYLRRMGG